MWSIKKVFTNHFSEVLCFHLMCVHDSVCLYALPFQVQYLIEDKRKFRYDLASKFATKSSQNSLSDNTCGN